MDWRKGMEKVMSNGTIRKASGVMGWLRIFLLQADGCEGK
jgi:hypothetical protein